MCASLLRGRHTDQHQHRVCAHHLCMVLQEPLLLGELVRVGRSARAGLASQHLPFHDSQLPLQVLPVGRYTVMQVQGIRAGLIVQSAMELGASLCDLPCKS